MKCFKGFNKDMTCNGFKYEEGKTYVTDKVVVCETGFHACEYPLDCFRYYYPCESVYHEVEQDGEIRKGGNTKVASTKIKIGERLTIAGLVKAAIEYITKRIDLEAKSNENYGASSATGRYGASSATGDCGASSATGNYGASVTTGNYGASSATGYCGASSATGRYGASSATGRYGASSATGDCGASSATGDYGASSATGYCGASSATGDCGASVTTGDYGASSATGRYGASVTTGVFSSSESGNPTAIAIGWGYRNKVKGAKGSYLVLSEWEFVDGENGEIELLKGVRLVHIDGKRYKPGVWYTLTDGKVVVAEEDD